MKLKIKKILYIILLVIIIIYSLFILNYKGFTRKEDTDKLKVVVTSFPAYDFVKNIGKENVEVTFLLKPGMESHSYEPTSQDMINIQNSDIFIYVGGELENWSEKVINSLNPQNTEVICLKDLTTLIEEKDVDGAIHEHEEDINLEDTVYEHNDEIKKENIVNDNEDIEYDEHVWTSLENAIDIVKGITEALINKDKLNEFKYRENSEYYISEIEKVKNDIEKVLENKVRSRLVFGDRMPMKYFINEFNLEVSAAFNGCSAESNANTKTIAYLIDIVRKENIPVVLYIELSNGSIAKTISEETGCDIMQIQTLHNISKEDFENGETYVSLMRRNIEVLKKALL